VFDFTDVTPVGGFDSYLLPTLPEATWDNSRLMSDGVLTVVPEPSTIVLLSIGAVGLLAWGWRRKR